MEPVDEKEMPKHLQVAVDVLAHRDPCVPEHLRPSHGASSSASVARWLPGESSHYHSHLFTIMIANKNSFARLVELDKAF